MTTNPTKRVIAYGFFLSPYSPQELDNELITERYIDTMGVTSFTRNYAGTRMAHGHSLNDGPKKSIHRKADGMFFFRTQEAMDTTIKLIRMTDKRQGKEHITLRELFANQQREHRVEIERIAGTKAYQPSEFD